MGSVTTRDPALHQRLKATHMRMGWGVGGNDAELLLRSLPSLPLRYAAQDQAGRELAAWWSTRPEVVAVLHPALPGSPGHEHWAALCSQAAGLFSVVFDARFGSAQVDAFVDALKLFRIGYSWAGPASLVVPYDLAAMRARPAWQGTLVRFSVGLEAVDDLIADCAQALAALGPAASLSGASARAFAQRMVRPAGVIVKDMRSSGGLPSAVATLSISKRPSRVARAIFISSIASCRPGQTRGPAPNGIETRLAALASRPGAARSQRSGSKRSARSKYSSRSESLRIAPKTSVRAGTRMSAMVVSRTACTISVGATGFRRIVSLAQASR